MPLLRMPPGSRRKLLLLQRNQVPLADFGDRGNVFQRNAAGKPLHAQVFSKAAHRSTGIPGKALKVFHLHNKPGFCLRQNNLPVWAIERLNTRTVRRFREPGLSLALAQAVTLEGKGFARVLRPRKLFGALPGNE